MKGEIDMEENIRKSVQIMARDVMRIIMGLGSEEEFIEWGEEEEEENED